jgi:nucleotide-binding universal stress UspA family protein
VLSDNGPILVPLDGSIPAEKPLRVAEALADLHGNEIAILYVSAHPFTPAETAENVGVPDEWIPRATLVNAVGEAADTICKVAKQMNARAILLSTHGASGNPDVAAGHVTLHVLQNPPCPVYVLRSALDAATQASRLRHLRRIVVPLDGNFESLRSVEEATALVSQSHARLFMLHIVDSRPETEPAPASPVFMDYPRYELEAWQDEFVRSSFAIAGPPDGTNMVVALRVGDPSEEIIRYALESDCDLLIVAWKGRLVPGRARVVERLLEQATYPVLFIVSRENAKNAATEKPVVDAVNHVRKRQPGQTTLANGGYLYAEPDDRTEIERSA